MCVFCFFSFTVATSPRFHRDALPLAPSSPRTLSPPNPNTILFPLPLPQAEGQNITSGAKGKMVERSRRVVVAGFVALALRAALRSALRPFRIRERFRLVDFCLRCFVFRPFDGFRRGRESDLTSPFCPREIDEHLPFVSPLSTNDRLEASSLS